MTMQPIHVRRYSDPSHGFSGWIEPEDRSWVLFIAVDGTPMLMRRTEIKQEPEAVGDSEAVDHEYQGVVRAKFKVQSNQEQYGAHTIYMYPVTQGSKENSEFFAATPGGQIMLGVVNPEASKPFVPGEEWYVDFHRAPKK